MKKSFILPYMEDVCIHYSRTHNGGLCHKARNYKNNLPIQENSALLVPKQEILGSIRLIHPHMNASLSRLTLTYQINCLSRKYTTKPTQTGRKHKKPAQKGCCRFILFHHPVSKWFKKWPRNHLNSIVCLFVFYSVLAKQNKGRQTIEFFFNGYSTGS